YAAGYEPSKAELLSPGVGNTRAHDEVEGGTIRDRPGDEHVRVVDGVEDGPRVPLRQVATIHDVVPAMGAREPSLEHQPGAQGRHRFVVTCAIDRHRLQVVVSLLAERLIQLAVTELDRDR